MRVFIAGATGVLGRRLLPLLTDAGHDVTGMTRTPAKAELLRPLGATPVIADALDAPAVAKAVAEARPDVVVHQLTAIPDAVDPRHYDRDFAATNRLRTEGTDHLLAAARAAGVPRLVAQGFAAFTLARTDRTVTTEDDARIADPPAALRTTFAALDHLEAAVTGAEWTEGLVLRYGLFYGPGTSLSLDPDGAQVQAVRARKFPLVGDGGGVWSFLHVDDAATATLAAVERGGRGLYNVTDDDPAPVRDWLPFLARAVGAPPPRRVPRWLARLLAGEAVTTMMTEAKGASNGKAKRALGWTPSYASWRQGFVEGLRPGAVA